MLTPAVTFAAKLVGRVVTFRNAVLRFVASWVPQHIGHVVHIDDSNGNQTVLYTALSTTSWRRGLMSAQIPNWGYFVLSLWDPGAVTYTHVCVSAHHLKTALHITNTCVLWAMTESGVCTLLNQYFADMCHRRRSVFAVMLNGIDVTSLIRQYTTSVELIDNMTATSVYYLCLLLSKHPSMWSLGPGAQDAEVVVTDFDLDTTSFIGAQRLVPLQLRQ